MQVNILLRTGMIDPAKTKWVWCLPLHPAWYSKEHKRRYMRVVGVKERSQVEVNVLTSWECNVSKWILRLPEFFDLVFRSEKCQVSQADAARHIRFWQHPAARIRPVYNDLFRAFVGTNYQAHLWNLVPTPLLGVKARDDFSALILMCQIFTVKLKSSEKLKTKNLKQWLRKAIEFRLF